LSSTSRGLPGGQESQTNELPEQADRCRKAALRYAELGFRVLGIERDNKFGTVPVTGWKKGNYPGPSTRAELDGGDWTEVTGLWVRASDEWLFLDHDNELSRDYWAARLGPVADKAAVEPSPSGSEHWWFKLAPGVTVATWHAGEKTNRALSWPAHFDVLSQRCGGVVAPPSAHHAGGNREWVKKPGQAVVLTEDEARLLRKHNPPHGLLDNLTGKPGPGSYHNWATSVAGSLANVHRDRAMFMEAMARVEARYLGDHDPADTAAIILGMWLKEHPETEPANHPSGPPAIPASSGLECTDIGNGDRFVRDHGEDVRNADGLGWFVWDGRLWRPDPETKRVRELAKRTARAIYREAEAAADRPREDELRKWAFQSQTKQRIDAMLWMAQSKPEIEVAADELDARPYLLTAGNGTIDLRTGALLPFSRGHLITKGTEIEYDPDAPCPRWEAWLKWFTEGQQELAEWVQTSAGFTLIGSSGGQFWIFMHGLGSNGKTTLTEVLAGLLGPDLAVTADPVMLAVARRQGGHSDALAALAGARMVYLAEVNSRGRWDEALIKHLTGGDKISASFKGGRTFQFEPRMTLWSYGNSMPEFQDDSDGFWRRIRLWELSQKVPPAQKIDRLWEVLLAEEGPGILAWAVRGAMRAASWMQEGRGDLPVPPAITQATEQFRNEQDRVGRFVRACLRRSENGAVTFRDLKVCYDGWLRRGGEEFADTQVGVAREVRKWLEAHDVPVRQTHSKNDNKLRGVVLR
jgi:putative DNA primase/helicase